MLRNCSAPGRFLFALMSILAMAGCINEKSLLGGGSSSAGEGPLFDGCLSASAVSTTAVEVVYEWPSGAQEVSVLRNGIAVFSSNSESPGTFLDDGLLEGRTYTYSCNASFRSSSGISSTEHGSKTFQISTLVQSLPNFLGVSSVSSPSSRKLRVRWPLATGVPTQKYVVLAKLGSAATDSDLDESLESTQELLDSGRLLRKEIQGSSTLETTLDNLGDQLSYFVSVYACNANGGCSEGDGVNDTISSTLPNAGAPLSPGATFAEIRSSQAVLTVPWNPSYGQVSRRRVYRRDPTGTVVIGAHNYLNIQNVSVADPTQVQTEIFVTASLAENTEYYFVVRDEDSLGNESSNSEVQSINTGDLTAPLAFAGICVDSANCPDGPSASTQESKIQIRWKEPADWNDYAGFRIFSVADDFSLTPLKDCRCDSNNCVTSPLNQCEVDGLSAFKTYKFHVRAFDASGNITSYVNPEFFSSSHRVIDQSPPVFSSSLSSLFSGGVQLSWAAASDNQDPQEVDAVLTYEIWRKENSTFANPTLPFNDGVDIATIDTRSYLDASVAGGITYYYTICALDASGNRSCDGVVESRYVDDIVAPSVAVSHTKTSTSKVWNLNLTLSDNVTPNASLAVVIKRKVSTSASDFPGAADAVYRAGSGLASLVDEGNPVISGTADLSRYVNYLVTVTDVAGNTATRTLSLLLDNLPPTPAPSFASTSPASPSRTSQTPSIRGGSSSNTQTIRIYNHASCGAGNLVAQGSKATFEGAGIALSLVANATTPLYAVAESASGTFGACTFLTNYTHDNIAPSATVSMTVAGSSGASILRNLAWAGVSETLASYCTLISSNPASENPSGCAWINSSTAPSSVSGTATADGNYNFVIWLRDPAGNQSAAIITSNQVTVDAGSPIWADNIVVPAYTTLINGLENSVSYIANATDSTSGVNKYQWAVGTGGATTSNSCGPACSDKKSWTDVALTSFTPSGIDDLEHNQSYYLSIRVLDNAGNYRVYSKSFYADLQNPVAPSITSHGEGDNAAVGLDGGLTISGTCDASNGKVTRFTSGAGVSPSSGTVTCSGGLFSLTVKMQSVILERPVNRNITVQTEAPSGRDSAAVTRNLQVTGACPEGYLPVQASARHGTSAYCIAKFEAKIGSDATTLLGDGTGYRTYGSGSTCSTSNVSGCRALSRPDGWPWTNLTQRQALVACDGNNAVVNGTGKYQLIRNDQWQAAADEMSQSPSNWYLGVVPVNGDSAANKMPRGANDTVNEPNAPFNSLINSFTLSASTLDGTTVPWTWTPENPDLVAELDAGYRGTGNNKNETSTGGWQERRTFALSNGDLVWDFAGNVAEYVRYTYTTNGAADSGVSSNYASRTVTGWFSIWDFPVVSIADQWFYHTSFQCGPNSCRDGNTLNPLWFTPIGNYWKWAHEDANREPMRFNLGGMMPWDNPSLTNPAPGSGSGAGSGNIVMRGGNNSFGSSGAFTHSNVNQASGVYATHINTPPGSLPTNPQYFGFRCVYNP